MLVTKIFKDVTNIMSPKLLYSNKLISKMTDIHFDILREPMGVAKNVFLVVLLFRKEVPFYLASSNMRYQSSRH